MIAPVNNPFITSYYGMRIINGKKEFHQGIDFVEKSRKDSRVYSISNGTCSYDKDDYNDVLRWTSKSNSAGNMVIIDYVIDKILYHVRYLHIVENYISKGQKIKEGMLIGKYGDVGISYGAHLHIDCYSEDWMSKLNISELFTKNGVII